MNTTYLLIIFFIIIGCRGTTEFDIENKSKDNIRIIFYPIDINYVTKEEDVIILSVERDGCFLFDKTNGIQVMWSEGSLFYDIKMCPNTELCLFSIQGFAIQTTDNVIIAKRMEIIYNKDTIVIEGENVNKLFKKVLAGNGVNKFSLIIN